jgi:hypothetical protein
LIHEVTHALQKTVAIKGDNKSRTSHDIDNYLAVGADMQPILDQRGNGVELQQKVEKHLIDVHYSATLIERNADQAGFEFGANLIRSLNHLDEEEKKIAVEEFKQEMKKL